MPMPNRWSRSCGTQGCVWRATTAHEKMGYKIREAQLEKIPYMLVVGAQEMENGTVSVRARKEEKGGTKTVEEFKAQVLAEVASRER